MRYFNILNSAKCVFWAGIRKDRMWQLTALLQFKVNLQR